MCVGRRRPGGSDRRPRTSVGRASTAGPWRSTAKTVAAGDIERSTVLVLDASNSMQRATSSTPPSPQWTPSSTPRRRTSDRPRDLRRQGLSDVIEPTTDHEAVRAALERRHAHARAPASTTASPRASTLLGEEGSRSLLVLSDGADTGSATTLDVRRQGRRGRRRRRRRRLPGQPPSADEAGRRSPTARRQVIPADPSAQRGLRRASGRAGPAAPGHLRRARGMQPARRQLDVTVDADGRLTPTRRSSPLGAAVARPTSSSPARPSSAHRDARWAPLRSRWGWPASWPWRSQRRATGRIRRQPLERLLRRQAATTQGQAAQVSDRPTSRARRLPSPTRSSRATSRPGSPNASPGPARL